MGRTLRGPSPRSAMRHRIAAWLLDNVPYAARVRWAAALPVDASRIRRAITDSTCEASAITADMLPFLEEPYRSGLLHLISEWALAIDRGQL